MEYKELFKYLNDINSINKEYIKSYLFENWYIIITKEESYIWMSPINIEKEYKKEKDIVWWKIKWLTSKWEEFVYDYNKRKIFYYFKDNPIKWWIIIAWIWWIISWIIIKYI